MLKAKLVALHDAKMVYVSVSEGGQAQQIADEYLEHRVIPVANVEYSAKENFVMVRLTWSSSGNSDTFYYSGSYSAWKVDRG